MNLHTESHYHYPQFAIEYRQRKVARSIQLGLIALLVCGALGLVLVGYQTSQVMDASEVVNLGGRQRMLSQRLAKQALLLRDARRASLADGQKSADGQRTGDGQMVSAEAAVSELEPMPLKQARTQLQETATRFDNEMEALWTAVEPDYRRGAPFAARHPSSVESIARHQDLRAAVTGVLEARSLADTETAIARVLRAEEAFLPTMERSVAEIEQAARQHLGVQAALSGLVVLLQAAIALAIWWFGIRPTAGRLREAVSGIAQRMNQAERDLSALQEYLRGFSDRLRGRLAEEAQSPSLESLQDPFATSMSLMRLQEKLLQLRIDANEFRSFLELGLHQQSLDPVPMRWNEMVKEAVDRCREEAAERSVEIREQYDPHAATELLGDARKLRHVLSSAIQRSLHALEIGEIQVRTQRAQSTPKFDWVRWEVIARGSFDPAQADTWIYRYCQPPSKNQGNQSEGVRAETPVCGRMAMLMGADVEVESLGESGWRISLEVKLPVRGKALLESNSETAMA